MSVHLTEYKKGPKPVLHVMSFVRIESVTDFILENLTNDSTNMTINVIRKAVKKTSIQYFVTTISNHASHELIF